MTKAKSLLLLAALMSVTLLVNAVPPPGGGNGNGGGSAPVDGGILALIAGVIAYGYRSFKARKGE